MIWWILFAIGCVLVLLGKMWIVYLAFFLFVALLAGLVARDIIGVKLSEVRTNDPFPHSSPGDGDDSSDPVFPTAVFPRSMGEGNDLPGNSGTHYVDSVDSEDDIQR